MFKINSLPEKILYSSVRIETENTSGQTGVGTGFIVSYIKNNHISLYLVTTKHHIKEAVKGKLLFIRSDGEKPIKEHSVSISINNFHKKWFQHPQDEIDIAIMPFNELIYKLKNNGIQIFFSMIDSKLIPSEKVLREDISTVEDILFPGYPDNIYDTKNLIPVIRKGVTSTPISMDFEGNPIFLIDASIFPGSSGSPIFIYNINKISSKHKELGNLERIFFVGILSNVFVKEDFIFRDDVGLNISNIPALQTRQYMNLGIVFKAFLIKDLIKEYQKAEFIISLLDYTIKKIYKKR